MAKKQREALFFVRKTTGAKDILFAVTGMPERTVGPAETAHYILFSGNKNNRYKMKINTVTYAHHVDGTVNREKIERVTPNFEKVTGILLKEMYEKCSPAFKSTFPLD